VSALAPLFRLLSPPGARARLSILIFHRVLPAPDPLFPDLPDAQRFDEILGWMKSWFNVLPLDHAVRQLRTGTLPARAAAITFDDGYADNFTVALPILLRRNLTATFFIATGFLDGGRMWNDTIIEAIRHCRLPAVDLGDIGLGHHVMATAHQRRAVIETLIGGAKYLPADQRHALADQIAERAGVEPPTDLMMSSQDVQQLRHAGMQIGAHTISHPMLTKLTCDDARYEIAQGKARLEDLLQERVGLFAYPNGKLGKDYVEEHATLVREIGFDAAVSTNWGAASRDSDFMQLPRFTPWDRNRFFFGGRLAANLVRTARNDAERAQPRRRVVSDRM
jgi:peptidoglycan/xylan/chitin deacetylase (PgdA/CDA1 family)